MNNLLVRKLIKRPRATKDCSWELELKGFKKMRNHRNIKTSFTMSIYIHKSLRGDVRSHSRANKPITPETALSPAQCLPRRKTARRRCRRRIAQPSGHICVHLLPADAFQSHAGTFGSSQATYLSKNTHLCLPRGRNPICPRYEPKCIISFQYVQPLIKGMEFYGWTFC